MEKNIGIEDRFLLDYIYEEPFLSRSGRNYEVIGAFDDSEVQLTLTRDRIEYNNYSLDNNIYKSQDLKSFGWALERFIKNPEEDYNQPIFPDKASVKKFIDDIYQRENFKVKTPISKFLTYETEYYNKGLDSVDLEPLKVELENKFADLKYDYALDSYVFKNVKLEFEYGAISCSIDLKDAKGGFQNSVTFRFRISIKDLTKIDYSGSGYVRHYLSSTDLDSNFDKKFIKSIGQDIVKSVKKRLKKVRVPQNGRPSNELEKFVKTFPFNQKITLLNYEDNYHLRENVEIVLHDGSNYRVDYGAKKVIYSWRVNDIFESIKIEDLEGNELIPEDKAVAAVRITEIITGLDLGLKKKLPEEIEEGMKVLKKYA
jgi:hypothetical protein